MTGLPAVAVDELCIAIDADCPNCGFPERVAPLSDFEARRPQRFACRHCAYVSLEREA